MKFKVTSFSPSVFLSFFVLLLIFASNFWCILLPFSFYNQTKRHSDRLKARSLQCVHECNKNVIQMLFKFLFIRPSVCLSQHPPAVHFEHSHYSILSMIISRITINGQWFVRPLVRSRLDGDHDACTIFTLRRLLPLSPPVLLGRKISLPLKLWNQNRLIKCKWNVFDCMCQDVIFRLSRSTLNRDKIVNPLPKYRYFRRRHLSILKAIALWSDFS